MMNIPTTPAELVKAVSKLHRSTGQNGPGFNPWHESKALIRAYVSTVHKLNPHQAELVVETAMDFDRDAKSNHVANHALVAIALVEFAKEFNNRASR